MVIWWRDLGGFAFSLSERKSTAVRDCKLKKEGGVATPEMVMVKRKTESYELLLEIYLYFEPQELTASL